MSQRAIRKAEVMELKPTCSSVHEAGDGVGGPGGAEPGRVESEALRRRLRPVDGQHVLMRDNCALLGLVSVLVAGGGEVFKEPG